VTTQPFINQLDLSTIEAVLLDMDGVMWRGSEILPGVPDFFLFLRARGIPYGMASNNSTKTAAEYVARLQSLGVPIEADHVITSSRVTVDELQRAYPAGTPIFVVGSESLSKLLTGCGYVIDPDNAQVVIAGLDVTFTYGKLQIAGRRIMAGAEFIGTNGDRTIPTPDGLGPGAGSILAAIQAMTGRAPRLMGKPEPAMFHSAVKHLGAVPERTLMIGDRLDTDILGAQNAGLKTALVLTGVNSVADIGAIRPDAVYDDLSALHRAWQK